MRKECSVITELKIDPEFRDKIPPMPIEDFNGLRDDILRDGYVRDPLTVWKEENILLDGHHRWRIIQENPDVLDNKYKIDYRSFPDRFACIAWICSNQLHKHNMTEIQRMKLIQEEHDAVKKSVGAAIGNKNAQKQFDEIHQIELCKTGKPGKEGVTRPTIAKEHGVSETYVQTSVEVGRGIDRAEEVEPGIKNEILSGSLKAKKKDLADIRKLKDDEEVKKKIRQIRSPAKVDIAEKERHDYTEQDAIDEIIVMVDEFIDKMERMLRIRSKVTMRSKTIAGLLDEASDKVLNLKGEIKCQ